MEGFGRNETNNLDIYWLQEILNAEIYLSDPVNRRYKITF